MRLDHGQCQHRREGRIGGGAALTEHLGAGLVQLYTAMIFEGPGIARRMAEGLAAILQREGVANIAEAVGTE